MGVSKLHFEYFVSFAGRSSPPMGSWNRVTPFLSNNAGGGQECEVILRNPAMLPNAHTFQTSPPFQQNGARDAAVDIHLQASDCRTMPVIEPIDGSTQTINAFVSAKRINCDINTT